MKKIFAMILFSMLWLLFAKSFAVLSKNSQENAVKQLHWITDAHEGQLCCGYYAVPDLQHDPETAEVLQKGQLVIHGGPVVYQMNGPATLTNATVSEPNRRLNASHLTLYRDTKTNKITVITASPQLALYEPGQLLVGQQGIFHVDTQAGKVWPAIFYVALGSNLNVMISKGKLTGTTAYGTATEIEQENATVMQLKHATFTTCAPTMNAWTIHAENIRLNKKTGRGIGKHVTLFVRQVPIFYTPYFNFPIDKRRQSGWLYPSLRYQSRSGLGLALPFYFNLAPQNDLLFTPTLFQKRVLGLQALDRYLTRYGQGQLLLANVPNDLAFQHFMQTVPQTFSGHAASDITRAQSFSMNRSVVSFHDHSAVGPHWQFDNDFNYTSDDYLTQDLDFPTLNPLAVPYQNLRQSSVLYQNEHWSVGALIQNYQTLHPINQGAMLDQYSRLPEINVHSLYPQAAGGFDYALDMQAVNFTHVAENFPDPFTQLPFATGERLHIVPALSYPWSSLGGYLTPTVEWALTRYSIHAAPAILAPGTSASARQGLTLTRSVPIVSLDSGLNFIENTSIFSHPLNVLIEPRLFYLYVPYVNQMGSPSGNAQNALPIFDTLLANFNYDQLFRTNRFTGIDRIGDANQVALGVTSRFVDPSTGVERASVSVGDMLYLQNRRVTLCLTPNCLDPGSIDNNTQRFSPLASAWQMNLNDTVKMNGNLAYDLSHRQLDNTTISMNYNPRRNEIFSLGYAYAASIPLLTNQTVMSSQSRTINTRYQLSFEFAHDFAGNLAKYICKQ